MKARWKWYPDIKALRKPEGEFTTEAQRTQRKERERRKSLDYAGKVEVVS